MLLISHRGCISGKDVNRENSIKSILNAIKLGFHVEVDVRLIDDKLYLGHDEARYEVDEEFLEDPRILVHCKDDSSYEKLVLNENIKIFQQEDELETFIKNPNNDIIILNHSLNRTVSKNRIIVFLGTYEEFKKVYNVGIIPYGIMTDYPLSFKEGFEKEYKDFDLKQNKKQHIIEFIEEIKDMDMEE